MKLKKYLAGSLLALMAMATACTSEELAGNTGGNETPQELPAGAVQFKIDGINTGAVQSRATGGNVLASAQENRVDNLTILIFGAEKENATPDELTFREYWTSEKRADYICDTEKKTFALRGMGKYYTATVVVPVELKSTRFVFITNEPRYFNVSPLMAAGTGTMPELRDLYKKGDDHLHTGHAFDGITYSDFQQAYLVTEAVDGVGVPADYTYTVPATIPCDKPVFEMQNGYFGFVNGKREALSMAGVSDQAINADGQSLSVTLYRNVARIDVSVDGGISLNELKLTNISALSDWEDYRYANGMPLRNFNAPVPDEVQSTFSLMKTDDATGNLIVPARSYCYPSVMGSKVSLIGKQADGTEFEIPFVDKDTKEQLTIKNNHRYTIKIRRTADNNIDANIIVAAWEVGAEIDIDMNGGDDLVPAPALHAASNYEFATWEGTGKVTCMVSNNYTLNSTNPATYPWLRFDLRQMSSLGLRMYYMDQEVNYPGAFFDPTMKVHSAVESADGIAVRHELMVTFPTASTQWVKLQNNFDPALNYVVKVETGNMEATGMNTKTPALIAFAETNVATNRTALINFPSGGFDGPYSRPVADWTAYHGQETTTGGAANVNGYALPTADQLQCIAPDTDWGRFDYYNGANVVKTFVNNDLVVYYSGSPRDRNVVKVVADYTQAGHDLGTAGQYVNVEATLWHYDARGYLRVNTVNLAISGTDAGRLTSYTALMDLFNSKRDVSAGYTRFFPASAGAETAYWGEGTAALVFSSAGVKFVPDYTGTGYTRPVMNNGVMAIPARQPVTIPARELKAPDLNGRPAEGLDEYWVAQGAPEGIANPDDYKADRTTATGDAPEGWILPTLAIANELAGVTLDESGTVITDPDFFKAFPYNSRDVLGTWYWLADEHDADTGYCMIVIGNNVGVYPQTKTGQASVRYIQKK